MSNCPDQYTHSNKNNDNDTYNPPISSNPSLIEIYQNPNHPNSQKAREELQKRITSYKIFVLFAGNYDTAKKAYQEYKK